MRPRRFVLPRVTFREHVWQGDRLIEQETLPTPRSRGRTWARLVRARDRRLLRAATRARYYRHGEAECLDCQWTHLDGHDPGLAQREARRHAHSTNHVVLEPCPFDHHRWNRHSETTIDGTPAGGPVTHAHLEILRADGHHIGSHITKATCMFCTKPHPRPSVFDGVPRGLGMGVA